MAEAHTSEKEHVQEIFQKWDTNGDGVIDAAELSDVLCELGIAQADVPKILKAADANHDGSIDYAEFLAYIFSSGVNEKVAAAVLSKDACESNAVPSGQSVEFHASTLGSAEGVVLSVLAGTTVLALSHRVAKELQVEDASIKLLVGIVALAPDETPVEVACADAWAAAVASGNPVQLQVIKSARRTLEATAAKQVSFSANAHPQVFTAPPGCPTSGNYDHTSNHYWGNHSGGGVFIRLQLPETHVQILEVRVWARAKDQGWGGTGSCGLCVVLLNAAGEELAYSAYSIDNHGDHELEWQMTPEAHGGHFPAKNGEEACGSVCGEGEGLALELRAFTPNWGGWSVTAMEGNLSATIAG